HWRAHVTHVLSIEFLQLVRRHLNPGGVLFFNTTNSAAIELTGVTVFPYGIMVGNCLALSDAPINPDVNRWKQVILEYRIDDTPVLKTERVDDQRKLAQLISSFSSLVETEQIRKRSAGSRIITDDNMASEWGSTRASASR
ncbi:MAG TPA: hypothetical protein VHM88_23860, partial [Candidatus Acidoferrales bacterium]|nr:hypothetical protein [Candidatus Acidoferrales bacterium]